MAIVPLNQLYQKAKIFLSFLHRTRQKNPTRLHNVPRQSAARQNAPSALLLRGKVLLIGGSPASQSEGGVWLAGRPACQPIRMWML